MDDLVDESIIFVCAATVGILKSALKGNTPVNRAVVKLTTIDEIAEIVEHRVADSARWHRKLPPSSGDYDNIVDDPVTKEHRDKSVRAYATARFAATQLAYGKRRVNDKADTDEWEGSRVHKNEIGRTPSFGFPRAHSCLRLLTDSPLTGEDPARPTKELKRSVSPDGLPSIIRRSPL